MSDQTLCDGMANKTNDISASKEPLIIEFEIVKIKEELDEEMVDESYFTMENEEDNLNMKDPLDTTMDSEIKLENIKYEDDNHLVVQEQVTETDIAVNTHCCHDILGKRLKVRDEFSGSNLRTSHTNMNDNLSEDYVIHEASSYQFDGEVSRKPVCAINDGSEGLPINSSSDIISLKFNEKIQEPTQLSNSQLTETGAKPFVCNVCVKMLACSSDLKEHMLTHTGEKPFVCDICEKSFTRSDSLKGHMRMHTGERPFACDTCEKSFTRSDILNEHKRRHTGLKPFVCDVCERSFAHLGNLKSHKRTHTGEKPFFCDDCEKSFNRLSHLKEHKRTHSGEKPFDCDVCGRSFAYLYVLKKHKIVHITEKLFVCNVCLKSFAHSSYLKAHLLRHTGQKPFTCDVCKKSFAVLSNLKKHKLKHT